MTQIRRITYQCNMNYTQSIQCFWNMYILNTILATVQDYAVMLLLSICEHLSVYWNDRAMSLDHNYSLQSNAMGEAFLYHAAPESVNHNMIHTTCRSESCHKCLVLQTCFGAFLLAMNDALKMNSLTPDIKMTSLAQIM